MTKPKTTKAAEEAADKMTPIELLDTIESHVEITDEMYRAAARALREQLRGQLDEIKRLRRANLETDAHWRHVVLQAFLFLKDGSGDRALVYLDELLKLAGGRSGELETLDLQKLARLAIEVYGSTSARSPGIDVYLSDGHWYGAVVWSDGSKKVHNIRVDEEQGLGTLLHNLRVLVERDRGKVGA